jgi:hypothetical protein
MKLCARAAGTDIRLATANAAPNSLKNRRMVSPYDFVGKLDGCRRGVNPSKRRAAGTVPAGEHLPPQPNMEWQSTIAAGLHS